MVGEPELTVGDPGGRPLSRRRMAAPGRTGDRWRVRCHEHGGRSRRSGPAIGPAPRPRRKDEDVTDAQDPRAGPGLGELDAQSATDHNDQVDGGLREPSRIDRLAGLLDPHDLQVISPEHLADVAAPRAPDPDRLPPSRAEDLRSPFVRSPRAGGCSPAASEPSASGPGAPCRVPARYPIGLRVATLGPCRCPRASRHREPEVREASSLFRVPAPPPLRELFVEPD